MRQADAPADATGLPAAAPGQAPHVQQLRLALLWPLRLMPAYPAGAAAPEDAAALRAPWQALRDLGDRSP